MMNRAKLVHILRAMAAITDERHLVVVGSAAVLLTSKNIPAQMLLTEEVDAFAPDAPDEEVFFDVVYATMGFGSRFAKTYTYYGDGVSSKTAIMPADWLARAKFVEGLGIEGVVVRVPDINDIALAKMMAWREKDRDWLQAGVRVKILDPRKMRERLALLPETDVPASEIERRTTAVAAYGGAA